MAPIRQDLLLEVTMFRQQNLALLSKNGEWCRDPVAGGLPQASGEPFRSHGLGTLKGCNWLEGGVGGMVRPSWQGSAARHCGRLLTLRTQARTSASTSGSTALAS